MSKLKVVSNDELLFNAARNGDYVKVIDMLSKGAGTGLRDEVSELIVKLYYC
jgi:hypothetical protein